MSCNGLCGICHKCRKGEIVPTERFSINEQTVRESTELIPVSAEYELKKNKVRKVK